MISIDIGAHVAGPMTTAARQYLIGSIDVLDAVNATYDANTLQVDGMELGIPPLLCFACAHPVLLQQRNDFGPDRQLF